MHAWYHIANQRAVVSMQDILLSNPVSGAPSAGISSSSGKPLGHQVVEGAGSFSSTLKGVYNAELSPEKLDEISEKLSSLGLDASFLDELESFLSGNLVSLDMGQEGMALPQLSSFLTTSMANLEKGLNLLSEEMTENLPEDLLNSVMGIIDSIQTSIQSQTLPLGGAGYQVAGQGSLAALSAVSVPGAMESSPLGKQAQASAMMTSGAANLQMSQAGSAVEGEGQLTSLSGLQVSSLNSQANGQSGNQPLQATLGNETFKQAMSENFIDASGVEALVDKMSLNTSDKNGITGLRATFADAQAKAENTPYSTTVMNGLDDLEWGQEVSQKIVWLTGKAIQSAEIHLNPAELGPIDVKISMQSDTAAVTFNAHNASVREMLESNVVRLREMMESNGVDLQEVNVDARQGDERYASKDQDGGSDGNRDQADDAEIAEEDQSISTVSGVSSNLVDYFA
jgi:flagellar hook-length control protein FliK